MTWAVLMCYARCFSKMELFVYGDRILSYNPKFTGFYSSLKNVIRAFTQRVLSMVCVPLCISVQGHIFYQLVGGRLDSAACNLFVFLKIFEGNNGLQQTKRHSSLCRIEFNKTLNIFQFQCRVCVLNQRSLVNCLTHPVASNLEILTLRDRSYSVRNFILTTSRESKLMKNKTVCFIQCHDMHKRRSHI